jgi:hypothetical protein
MKDELGSETDGDLVSRLEDLVPTGAAVTVVAFEAFTQNFSEKMSVMQLRHILDFASRQVGAWEAEYSFSPADSPNTAAKTESERWEALWVAWSERFIKLVPDIAEQTHRIHRLISAKPSLERAVRYNEQSPLRKMVAGTVSRIAIALGKIGVSGLATQLYAFSLYPKGSVGRGKV